MSQQEFLREVERTIELYEKEIGTFASRTRGMIDRLGAIDALSKLTVTAELQQGFRILRDRNKLDTSFEALIVRYPSLFAVDVVDAARWRLENADNL